MSDHQLTTGAAAITGATTEQIAAAVERALVDEPYRHILGVEQQTRGVIAASAIYLVPPDHRIVPAHRVLTDDLAHWLTYHKDDRDFLFDYLEACIDEDTDAQQRVVTRDMFDRLLEALRGQADRMTEPQPTTERFTKHETWGLYWVAWWMDEHQRNGTLGGTLTEAHRIVREMIGPLPEGYSYDPDDERHIAADAARTEGTPIAHPD